MGFNIVYQQSIVMYDSSCQICCNWSRLKLGFNVPAHWSTMLLNGLMIELSVISQMWI